MNAEDMTIEQLEALLQKKKHERDFKVHKTATLKHDLYLIDDYHIVSNMIGDSLCDWGWCAPALIPDSEDQQMVLRYFKKNNAIKIPKGTKFDALKNYDTEELQWFDAANIGAEEMDDDWAERHLENFKEVK